MPKVGDELGHLGRHRRQILNHLHEWSHTGKRPVTGGTGGQGYFQSLIDLLGRQTVAARVSFFSTGSFGLGGAFGLVDAMGGRRPVGLTPVLFEFADAFLLFFEGFSLLLKLFRLSDDDLDKGFGIVLQLRKRGA